MRKLRKARKPKVKKQCVLRSFTFRYPLGSLDRRVVGQVSEAQSNAAFASDRPYSHISMPSDWCRAYKQGFRVVPVTMKSGPTHAAWKGAAALAD